MPLGIAEPVVRWRRNGAATAETKPTSDVRVGGMTILPQFGDLGGPEPAGSVDSDLNGRKNILFLLLTCSRMVEYILLIGLEHGDYPFHF